MRIGRSYKQHGVEGDFDAIVVGSGMGGLCAAALLARQAGKRVLVLERHYTAGGFTHAFSRPGYEWDVGVHYVGEVVRPNSTARRLFDLITDGELQWESMGDVYDRILIGDDAYDYVAGRERWRERMCEYFPDQRDAIDRFLSLVRGVHKKLGGYFAAKALPGFLAGVLGPLLRMPVARYARQTTRQVMSGFIDDPRLLGVLTAQFGDYGLPPSKSSFLMHAVLVGHYLGGAAYPVGGATRIAATILPLIERAGGAVVTSAEVDGIVVRDRRAVGVRLVDGAEVFAPIVISDAGLAGTVRRLLPDAVARDSGLLGRLQPLSPSMAHVSLYVGLPHSDAELGLAKPNLWVFDHADHDRSFDSVMHGSEVSLPGAFISFPSAKDPDFQRRYPGRATVEVVSFVPMQWFDRWRETSWKKRGDEYEELKGKLTEQLRERLFKHVPQVRGKIEICELSTPLSTLHFTGHANGEVYGLAHDTNRFRANWLRPATPIRGLYLTGADVATCGVVGAAMGGVLCASAVLGRNVLADIRKSRAGKG